MLVYICAYRMLWRRLRPPLPRPERQHTNTDNNNNNNNNYYV